MIYSTCSMNPIENEAVVAEVISRFLPYFTVNKILLDTDLLLVFLQILRCGSSVELVDVSDKLPELIRRPGLKKWKVNSTLKQRETVMENFKSCLFLCGFRCMIERAGTELTKMFRNRRETEFLRACFLLVKAIKTQQLAETAAKKRLLSLLIIQPRKYVIFPLNSV